MGPTGERDLTHVHERHVLGSQVGRGHPAALRVLRHLAGHRVRLDPLETIAV